MKRVFTISLILFFSVSVSLIQSQTTYKQAGLRSGYMGGLYFQVTGNAGNAETGFMALLGFRNNGIQFTGLRIVYETTLDELSPDLYVGWGYGGHAGFIITDNLRFMGDDYYFRGDRFCPLFGIDGWGTLEYRFRSVPLVVGLNIKPYIELTIPSFIKIMPGDIGISIAYSF